LTCRTAVVFNVDTGSIVGGGADLYESSVGAIIAPMLIGASVAVMIASANTENLMDTIHLTLGSAINVVPDRRCQTSFSSAMIADGMSLP
jgi:Na+/H+-translocating membrane pyrophosphatase